MARAEGKIHDTGDFFPVMEVATVGGESVMLPGDFIGNWSVVLLYRGHW